MVAADTVLGFDMVRYIRSQKLRVWDVLDIKLFRQEPGQAVDEPVKVLGAGCTKDVAWLTPQVGRKPGVVFFPTELPDELHLRSAYQLVVRSVDCTEQKGVGVKFFGFGLAHS